MAAKPKPAFNPVPLLPLTGGLDTRSLPQEVPFGSPRWSQNMTATAPGRLCRRAGWDKLLSETVGAYNNADLHDQLFSYTPQPIQFLFEAISDAGTHRLLAGTQNRIYALDNSINNYNVLSDALGGTPTTSCSTVRWRAAQVDNTVVFTNGADAPVYWTFDSGITSGTQSVAALSDFTTLNITKVDVLYSWKGVLFAANVVADGVRVNSRIMWSDLQKPLSFTPSLSSIAGFQDLGFNENILAISELDDVLLIYTNRSIWTCAVGDPTTTIFTFTRRYTQPNGHGCLTYRNTLINTGTEHVYMSRDGIFAFNLYSPAPVRTEWIHAASGYLYSTIDATRCDLQIGGWNAQAQEAWFSWVTAADDCPKNTLVINTQFESSDYLPVGFTTFANYRPSTGDTITDYLTDNCICAPDDLTILDQNSPLLGGQCVVTDPPSCDVVFNSLYTTVPATIVGFSNFIEDANQSVYDPSSLYAVLRTVTINDLCNSELTADQCNAAQKFIAVASYDNCIKQYGSLYGYSRCTSKLTCGTYITDKYASILRSGPISLNAASQLKVVKRFLIDYQAASQNPASNVTVRLGFSRQPADPNSDNCPIIWQTLPTKRLACASPLSESAYAASNTQPYLAMEWPVYLAGNYIYWEITVNDVGGNACFGAVTMDAAVKPQGV